MQYPDISTSPNTKKTHNTKKKKRKSQTVQQRENLGALSFLGWLAPNKP